MGFANFIRNNSELQNYSLEKYAQSGIWHQLIVILGDHVQTKILDQVLQASWFRVIADEVTHTSNKVYSLTCSTLAINWP